MKKINKLEISPEKIMKNEELINLQGGYEGECPGECAYYLGGWTYCNVCYAFIQEHGHNFDAWCCASCSDPDRFWWAQVC